MLRRIQLLIPSQPRTELTKSHVEAHWRTDSKGVRHWVSAYDDRRVKQLAAPKFKKDVRAQESAGPKGLIPGKAPNQKAYPMTYRMWAGKFVKKGIPEPIIQQITKENGGLLNLLVQKYAYMWNRGDEGIITRDDVWAAARLGAFNAIATYKPGNKFSTWLRYHVITQLHNMIEATHGRHFKLDKAESRAFRSFIKHMGKLTADLGRTPREDEFISTWSLKKRYLHPDYPNEKEEVPDTEGYIHTAGAMEREKGYGKVRSKMQKEHAARLAQIEEDIGTSQALLRRQYNKNKKAKTGLQEQRAALKQQLQQTLNKYNKRLSDLKSPSRREALIDERDSAVSALREQISSIKIMSPHEYQQEVTMLDAKKTRMIGVENKRHLQELGDKTIDRAPGKAHYYQMFSGLVGTKFHSTSKDQTGEDESSYDHLFASSAPNPEELYEAKEAYRNAWLRVQDQITKMNQAARRKNWGPLGNIIKLMFHVGTMSPKHVSYLEDKYGIAEAKGLAEQLRRKVEALNSKLATNQGNAKAQDRLVAQRSRLVKDYEERIRSIKKTAYTDDTLPMSDVAVMLGIPYKKLVGESLRPGVSRNEETQRAKPGLLDRALELAKEYLSEDDLRILRDTSYVLRGTGVSREEALVKKALSGEGIAQRVISHPSIFKYMMERLGMDESYQKMWEERAKRLRHLGKDELDKHAPGTHRLVNTKKSMVRVHSWDEFVR